MPERLDIWAALHKRSKRKVEINRSHVSSILYQGALRRQAELATMRAERQRILGHMTRWGTWRPESMRLRQELLNAALGPEPSERIV